jgi:hypothetical protein
MAEDLPVPTNNTVSPKTPSSDYNSMAGFWQMVDTILAGAQALRNHASLYLPRFENETQKDYANRVTWAPLTNIYADISRNLASKPFAKQLTVAEGSDDAIVGTVDAASDKRTGGFIDNVDGQGNNLHVFASNSFKDGIDHGLTWILVDYPSTNDDVEDPDAGRVRSQADEKAMGLRPFWVFVPASKVIAAYSEFENGVEVLTHVRIDESATVRSEFGEQTVERVRVIDRAEQPEGTFGPATWTLFEKQRDAAGKEAWVSVGQGVYTIGMIPMVPVFIGKRQGMSFQVEPPLRDLAYMQIEEFQQESNLKTVKNLTAFPMLVFEGGTAPVDADGQKTVVPVGPRSVLFPGSNAGGGNASVKFVEPSATSLKFLEDSLATFRKEMRDLGMQPLTEANLTVITTANVSKKASSAVQAWAILFQDALERCFGLTAQWLDLADTTEVLIHTDFALDLDDSGQPEVLIKSVSQGILSKKTVRGEFKRRGLLSDEFDEQAEEERIAEETQGLEPEMAIDPITGELVQPTDRPRSVTTKASPQAVSDALKAEDTSAGD